MDYIRSNRISFDPGDLQPDPWLPLFVGSTLAPAASPTVTAGLTWQPDTWPTHCARLATVTPKHRAILHKYMNYNFNIFLRVRTDGSTF